MTRATGSRTVYAAEVVHDEPDEANVAQRDLGYHRTLREAVAAVNAARNDYWQTGGVYSGELILEVPGVEPERFLVTLGQGYFVGTDGKAER